ncbi:unnamed protein product [Ceutorhynchus assimilis]|uniref:Right handed beta helix domain-containing protein n=1 Tax=Ceutorhynchus assimilis TaxID=467358 RepID=A0A9N9QPN4_9CUCU|nr:unnamed protein product [Ceutorhynchus assimilis]
MDQIITFDKSLQTRLEEYKNVFVGSQTLLYSQIQKEWAYHLELSLDPNGWQAVWKIPRLKCEELKIPFPTVVLVYVLDVAYLDLAALVRILAVQDDIHLPEKHHVPLTQLWPTKQQDKTIALNLHSTANALDMLRFFYIHILMPWDEEDDTVDWKGTHLFSRLKLYYDLKNGNIPKGTSEHIHALLNEARRLNSKRQHLVNLCTDDSDLENTCDTNLETLIEINVRLIEIQNEINLFENEIFRKVILKRQESSELKSSDDKDDKPHIWIVLKNATAKDYIKILQSVEDLYPDQTLSFAPNLMSKLESANCEDTFLLSPKIHIIKREGVLIENFTLKGIGNRDFVQIVSQADDVMFDCIQDSCTIENITFDCKNTQCALLIRKGQVTMKNCKIVGDSSSTTHQGILVLNGAKLTLDSCDISGFSMAIIGNSGSTIDIKNSNIHEGYSGIKIYDHCVMGIYGSCISNFKEYGIILETEQDLNFDADGNSFNNLNCVPNIITDSLSGENNGKGNVAIKKSKIKAMENLFENPDSDPTILQGSDDEMDTSQGSNNELNDTVIEIENKA